MIAYFIYIYLNHSFITNIICFRPSKKIKLGASEEGKVSISAASSSDFKISPAIPLPFGLPSKSAKEVSKELLMSGSPVESSKQLPQSPGPASSVSPVEVPLAATMKSVLKRAGSALFSGVL